VNLQELRLSGAILMGAKPSNREDKMIFLGGGGVLGTTVGGRGLLEMVRKQPWVEGMKHTFCEGSSGEGFCWEKLGRTPSQKKSPFITGQEF